MTKPVNFRFDAVTQELLEEMVKRLTEEGIRTNKTDVVQKAIFMFAKESVLDSARVTEIVEKHYCSFK